MLGALAASQEQQRRLVADAGHELRTPLTSMRTNLELLAAAARPGAPPLPESDRAEILDDLQAQISELSTLVGDLVELARDDAPQVVHEPVELTDVDLPRARTGAAAGRATSSSLRRSCRGRSSATRRRWNARCSTCSTTPPSGARRAGRCGCRCGRSTSGPSCWRWPTPARASRSRTCRASSTASTARPGAHDARLGARTVDRAAGRDPARRRGVGRTRAGGWCAARAASARAGALLTRAGVRGVGRVAARHGLADDAIGC